MKYNNFSKLNILSRNNFRCTENCKCSPILHLACCSYSSRFGHWELFQLAPATLWQSPITVGCLDFCLLVKHFVNSDTTRCSRLVFPCPGNQPFIQGVLISFNGEQHLETKIHVNNFRTYKSCSTLLIIRETQVKAKIYHYSLIDQQRTKIW